MLEILKVKVEPLQPAAFALFGQVISTFDEAKPEVVVGALTENAYAVRSDPNDLTAELELSTGNRERAIELYNEQEHVHTLRPRVAFETCTAEGRTWSMRCEGSSKRSASSLAEKKSDT